MALVYRNEYSYCGPISMLERLQDGDLLLVFREARWRGQWVHADPTTRTSLLRSSDGGRSWHSLVTPDPAGGNGTAIAQLSDGTLLVNNFRWVFAPLTDKDYLTCRPSYREFPELGLARALDGVYTCRSWTGGYTWSAPTRLDLPAFPALTTAGRVVELPDGSLLMPLSGRRTRQSTFQGVAACSADRGEHWEFWAEVTPQDAGIDFHETRMAWLPDGTLLAMHRTEARNFFRSLSADGGRTWSEPVETPIWCGGSSPPDLLVLKDGRVLCTYGHRRPPFGVRACLSEDGGRTWDLGNEKMLRDDGLGRDMGYPSSEQLEDGSILTAYYWHADDQIRYLEGSIWRPE